jgi:cysteinyl-tRNA synthetase
MNDDLNVSSAISALFDFIKKANPAMEQGMLDARQKNGIRDALERINQVLGFLELRPCPLAPEIDRLIQEREAARGRQDWERADAAREELSAQGIIVHDTVGGPVWECMRREDKECVPDDDA